MIVKFLQKAGTFKGVGYNTEKMVAETGELMKAENFGALEGMENLRPQDYVNYLEALTVQSSRIKYPQLHVVISCKGRSHSKEQLTEIAEQWLNGMGYGQQPYLLVFHSDTKNNHIHLVSTRIGRDGKKIDHKFERVRAYQVLNKIMEQQPEFKAVKDIANALTYRFGTRAQFMMVLESQGYGLRLEGSKYLVFKFGTLQAEVSLAQVDERIKSYSLNINRLSQLRAVFHKYRNAHDPALFKMSKPLPGERSGEIPGWNSLMADHLKNKLGVQVLFHSKEEKPAYAYSLVDHAKKFVCKGGELMPLAEFSRPNGSAAKITGELPPPANSQISARQVQPGVAEDRADLPDDRNRPVTADHPADDFTEPAFIEEYLRETAMDHFSIDIADDIDDEAILGMKRHRKRKARTNTR